ncbi:MAG: hypothetical protein ABIG30_00145 [Candidatus Aenigmatarchaeota archaeon]
MMKYAMMTIILAVVLVISGCDSTNVPDYPGSPQAPSGNALTVSQILAAPDTYIDKTVTVSGTLETYTDDTSAQWLWLAGYHFKMSDAGDESGNFILVEEDTLPCVKCEITGVIGRAPLGGLYYISVTSAREIK